METQALTQLEFGEADHAKAARIARSLGYTQNIADAVKS